MDEPVQADPRAEWERSVNLRLDELSRQMERLLTLVCPVCGPDLVRQIHPDDAPLEVLARKNGSG